VRGGDYIFALGLGAGFLAAGFLVALAIGFLVAFAIGLADALAIGAGDWAIAGADATTNALARSAIRIRFIEISE
jgi:hypothetical protein